MYRYKLKEFKMEVLDAENNQHKIVDLQYPKTAFDYEELMDYITSMVSRLSWLPNERGLTVDTREMRKLEVKEL